MTESYHDPKFPDYIVRNATLDDDVQLVSLIGETMPSNGMILSFQRQPSYWVATRAQYEFPALKVVVPKNNPKQIVGMMNIGSRPCFINGETQQLRYVGDLRLSRHHRGNDILPLLMSYLYTHVPLETIYQVVILDDNTLARHILHKERKGFPKPFIYDQICTYTVTAFKKKVHHSSKYKISRFTQKDIPKVHTFWEEMSEFYNFLPKYDFNQLWENHPYWNGINLEDFYCLYNTQDDIVGFYGLWDQKSFKQTTVKSYSKLLKFIRPFYNMYARLRQDLLLPKENGSFDYLMLHSALCAPHANDVFEAIMVDALEKTKQKGKQAFCTTLSLKDPRTTSLQFTRHHKMAATHSLHSFDSDPYEYFDPERISYIEVGRI